ncbi:hypothetical protein GCM10027059_03090 [Myceligenerans halotolerans]
MSTLVRAAIGRARSLSNRFDAALVAPGRPGPVVVLQTGLSLVIALRLLVHDWALVADRPAELTYRLWTLGWLPHLPVPVLIAIQVAGLVGVGLVLARRAPGVGFALSWCALLVLAGLWGASGKFMHNDVLLLTASVPVLFARLPALGGRPGRTSEAVPRQVAWGWPPRAALAVVACVYFLTGLQKLRHSGLAWVFSDNMSWVLRQGAGSSPVSPDFVRWLAETPVLPQLLAGGALALELGAPLLLLWRPTRLVFAAAVTAMHLSIWACLGLDYSPWWLTVWVVAIATGIPTGWAAVRNRIALRRAAAPLDEDEATELARG